MTEPKIKVNFFFRKIFCIYTSYIYLKIRMDADYSLFDATDEQLYKEVGSPLDSSNSELILLSIVNGVKQYYFLDKIYEGKLKKRYLAVRDSLKRKYFCKLYQLLERLDLEELEKFLETSSDFHDSITPLQCLMNYFVEFEEYERCSLIKKVQNLVENSPKVCIL